MHSLLWSRILRHWLVLLSARTHREILTYDIDDHCCDHQDEEHPEAPIVVSACPVGTVGFYCAVGGGPAVLVVFCFHIFCIFRYNNKRFNISAFVRTDWRDNTSPFQGFWLRNIISSWGYASLHPRLRVLRRFAAWGREMQR